MALSVLEYARAAVGGAACNCVRFFALHARTLVALADAKALRWIFQFALAGV